MTDDRFRPNHDHSDSENTDAFPRQNTEHYGTYPNNSAYPNQSQQPGGANPGHPGAQGSTGPTSQSGQSGSYPQPGPQSGQSGQYPAPGHGQQPSGQYPVPGQYPPAQGHNPSAASAGSGPSGQYPAPGQPYGQAPYGYQQPPRGKGRLIALIAILLTLILVLVGLGVWWWNSKSNGGDNAPGADNADQALEQFVDRFNSGDLVSMKDSVAPAEKQYLSAVSTLVLRSTWDSIDVGDQDELFDNIAENAEELQDSMEFSLTVDETTTVGLGEGMEAKVITDGHLLIDVVDDQKFAETMEKIVTENFPEEQRQEWEDMLLDSEYDSLEEAFLDGANDFPIEGELDDVGLPLVFVDEEAGWYLSPMTTAAALSSPEFFTDDSLRDEIVSRQGEFQMPEAKHFDSPEQAAAAFFEEGLQGSIMQLPQYLPLAEARPLALIMYLNSDSAFGAASFRELVQFSDVSFSSIEVSEHSAIAMIESITMTMNPMMTGTGGQFKIADGEFHIPGCQPIDISVLQDEDKPLLAVSVIQDETGWSVSLGATFANISGSIGGNPEVITELEQLGEDFNRCS